MLRWKRRRFLFSQIQVILWLCSFVRDCFMVSIRIFFYFSPYLFETRFQGMLYLSIDSGGRNLLRSASIAHGIIYSWYLFIRPDIQSIVILIDSSSSSIHLHFWLISIISLFSVAHIWLCRSIVCFVAPERHLREERCLRYCCTRLLRSAIRCRVLWHRS